VSVTLKDLKEELRIEIGSLKEALINLKDESCGVDAWSGHYAQTGKYDLKCDIEAQLENSERFLKLLCKVKKLK
jgi:hypothetical protein